jgi:hypothetical protein
MNRLLCTLSIFLCTIARGWTADAPVIKFPSPDGRFALRVSEHTGEDGPGRKADLIEKSSGKAIVDLGPIYGSHLADTVLIWSANSKWAAYATRDNRDGETDVYFWNGSAFTRIALPENLPRPDIKFGKGAGESVKNYGGGITPVRWLKSGNLELSSDSMMLSHINDRSYTGVLRFTIAFDAQHQATVHTIGKTVTTVDR